MRCALLLLTWHDDAQLTSHRTWVTAIELYSQDVVVSASSDQSIRVWQYPASKASGVLKGHTDYVTVLCKVSEASQRNACVRACT